MLLSRRFDSFEFSESRLLSYLVFCTSQKLVNQQWFGMQSTDKQEVRQFFTQFLMSSSVSCPVYIQKKLAKVYVNIGRLDWPQFFPDFYHNIIQVKT